MKNIKLMVLVISALFILTACSCSKKEYTITFDTDGGSLIDEVKVSNGEKVTKPSDPIKEGYTFDGWYIGEVKYDFSKEVTSDLTLKAKWSLIEEDNKEDEVKTTTYKVTLDIDGVKTTIKVKENNTLAVPATPTKEGYTFEGWYLNDEVYNFNSKVTKNITLVAKWTKNPVISYTIEKLTDSVLGQVKIYVTKDDVKTKGYFDLVETDGTIHENIEVSENGIDFNEKLIKEIKNVKIK